MKPLIMGTAGHIDHGKTALVRMLTGIECDTHPQEKARGITINLGFAHLELPSGDSIGIVDVPGHRDFVHTMVGGACGIDFALLVVAADDGVMPQTVEHLRIMELLGIRGGLTAITKSDLADREILDFAIGEVKELTAGTFLDGQPVIPVSSVTGQGGKELLEAISETAAGLENRSANGPFRLFIDRSFSAKGFGSVVTGSVLRGELGAGDKVFLLPSEKKVRVRRIERHGVESEKVFAGDRAAINLAGVSMEELPRGTVLSGLLYPSTVMLDASLSLFDNSRPQKSWFKAVFHLGAYENEARIHLLDCDLLRPGHNAVVQIHLEYPCPARRGDRYVLRSSSADITIGGGVILDAFPLHHRRRKKKVIDQLRKLAAGDIAELIASEVRKRWEAVFGIELAADLELDPAEVQAAARNMPADIEAFVTERGSCFFPADRRRALEKDVLEALAAHHRAHPLNASGRSFDDLAGLAGKRRTSATDAVLAAMLDNLCAEGKIKRVEDSWALAEHAPAKDPNTLRKIEWVAAYIERSGMRVPVMKEMAAAAEKEGIETAELEEIIRRLVNTGRVYRDGSSCLPATVVDVSRRALLEALAEKPAGLTVAEFRDTVSGNRKACLAMLAVFESEGIVRRRGDVRVLTDTGREKAREMRKA